MWMELPPITILPGLTAGVLPPSPSDSSRACYLGSPPGSTKLMLPPPVMYQSTSVRLWWAITEILWVYEMKRGACHRTCIEGYTDKRRRLTLRYPSQTETCETKKRQRKGSRIAWDEALQKLTNPNKDFHRSCIYISSLTYNTPRSICYKEFY